MSDWCEFDRDLAEIGAIEPVFEEELVGYADRRVVHDGHVEARFWPEGAEMLPDDVEWHYEDINPVPQYRKVLRWRRVS